jgi:hypothetical protein
LVEETEVPEKTMTQVDTETLPSKYVLLV